MCLLQREHKELLNRTHTGARCSGAGSSSDCRAGTSSSPGSDADPHAPGSSSDGSQPGALTARSGAALVAADPAAALHRMHTNLQALRVRKQQVTGGTPLSELQQQAESASERLLLVKLQEAGRIMEEQETVSCAGPCSKGTKLIRTCDAVALVCPGAAVVSTAVSCCARGAAAAAVPSTASWLRRHVPGRPCPDCHSASPAEHAVCVCVQALSLALKAIATTGDGN